MRTYDATSLPVRGAWVEILASGQVTSYKVGSLPVRGAWVEIVVLACFLLLRRVAPRAGSVG